MLISHETPLDLLETSLTFNDYDYCLPTYYKKYSKYKEFFLRSRKMGRHIILDNGLFEGDNFTTVELMDLIEEIQPDRFIVPDAWNNAYTTLSNAKFWIENIKPRYKLNTELMMVPQGKSYAELSELVWSAIKLGYTNFGFNHSSIAYSDVFPNSNPLISRMMGRVVTINKLMEEDVFNKLNKCKIHLLGMNLPQEMMFHNKQNIYSVDTSNPVIVGIKGKRYENLGIDFKPEEKIEVFMEKDLAPNFEDIIFNIQSFRKMCY